MAIHAGLPDFIMIVDDGKRQLVMHVDDSK